MEIPEEKDSLLKQIDKIIVIRRIRLLGIMICAALFLIYALGMIVPVTADTSGLETISIASVAACILLTIASFPVKNYLFAKTEKSFEQKLFTAHIVAFALCDAGGIFCITANLFISPNTLYATVGMLIAVICIAIHLPRESNLV